MKSKENLLDRFAKLTDQVINSNLEHEEKQEILYDSIEYMREQLEEYFHEEY